VSRPSLDWSDPIAVSAWIGRLRGHVNDADAVARDLLRPPRERELGPVLARENYDAAHAAIVDALNFASAPEPDVDDGADHLH
jgi:hypothetical protein